VRPPHDRVASIRLRVVAGLALLAELACIAWFATAGGHYQMQIQSFAMLGDKAVHALAFCLAGLTASLASRISTATALGLCAVAGGIEILQSFVPGRTASVTDFAASVAGVAAGVALGAALWPILLRTFRRT
jgi:VanZ family protein